jgi:DNA-binding CsgD family transcriptional regulator
MDRGGSAARRVAGVAAEALTAGNPGAAMRCVTNALLDALGADNAIYHEFHHEGWGVLHATAPADVWDVLPIRGAPTSELRRLHPGVDAMCRYRGYRPFALTDIVSERQWRDYEFRDLLRPTCGKALKLHIGVDSPRGVARGWSLTRNGSDYSRADLEVAEALQPVLDVVVQQYAADLDLRLETQGLLTGREVVVLRCLSEGLTAGAIGRRLGVSSRTVTKHVEHIYRKLCVRDRVAALSAAARLGLIGNSHIPVETVMADRRRNLLRNTRPSSPFTAPLF